MATHNKVKPIREKLASPESLTPKERALFIEILELLDQAVFIDDLPQELGREIKERRKAREPLNPGSWSRGYKCSIHGTITAALCGDCAREGVSPSANVTRK